MFSTTDNTSLCAWQAAASDPSWIRLPTTTGTESSTLFYNVDANISPQIRLGAIVVTWTGGGAAQLSITQESTSTTFRLSGSLVNGASINGAVAIDIRAGTVTAGTVTIGAPDSVTLTRALSGPVTRNSDGAVIAMQIQILPPTGSPNLILTLPVTSLVNYGGGTVCATVCNKAGDSGLVYSSNTVVAVASATLTPE
jgi:hypothetical protein